MAGCTLSGGIYLSRTELKEGIYNKIRTSNGIKEHTKSVKSLRVFPCPKRKNKGEGRTREGGKNEKSSNGG